MAEINGPTMTCYALFGLTSLTYLVYHTYAFDRCRCLIPTRKAWFRGLLTWMLFLSNMSLIAWASGWSYVKAQLGWVRLGPAGARPWPSALFPYPYTEFNRPLTILLNICYACQASLTVEEALYWAHLIRSIRRPRAAVPFLRSRFFYAWVVITIVVTAVQLAIPWIGHDGNLQLQLCKELLAGGIVELLVWLASFAVVLRFPKFLKEVQASGAGPEAQARLFYYHELNKIRTMLRFFLIVPLLILGADGITPAAAINLNPLASDFLGTLSVISLCVVFVISIILYLPIAPPSARYQRVSVGQQHAASANHGASGFPIMSLLRDGGRWDVDDDLVAEGKGADAPFAHAEEALPTWGGHGLARPKQPATQLLDSFTSPLVPSTEARPQGPVEIRMQVERDVHVDGGEDELLGAHMSRRGRVLGGIA